jgi:hypothetical protein
MIEGLLRQRGNHPGHISRMDADTLRPVECPVLNTDTRFGDRTLVNSDRSASAALAFILQFDLDESGRKNCPLFQLIPR